MIAPSAADPVGCNLTPAPGVIAPSAAPANLYKDADENPDAYRLFSAEALPEASPMPDEIRAKISQLVGKRSMTPMPLKTEELPTAIFTTPPTLAEAREKWAALPEHREQIKKEIADHPHWDLEIVDGCIQEIPF